MTEKYQLIQSQSAPGPAFKLRIYFNKGLVEKTAIQVNERECFEWQLWGDEENQPLQNQLNEWCLAFLRGENFSKKIPYALEALPPFMQAALHIVAEIPFGKTLSYKEVAVLAGSPLAARAVGTSCSRNPVPLLIPCHRVLSSTGLGGYSGGNGVASKQILLNFEAGLI